MTGKSFLRHTINLTKHFYLPFDILKFENFTSALRFRCYKFNTCFVFVSSLIRLSVSLIKYFTFLDYIVVLFMYRSFWWKHIVLTKLEFSSKINGAAATYGLKNSPNNFDRRLSFAGSIKTLIQYEKSLIQRWKNKLAKRRCGFWANSVKQNCRCTALTATCEKSLWSLYLYILLTLSYKIFSYGVELC